MTPTPPRSRAVALALVALAALLGALGLALWEGAPEPLAGHARTDPPASRERSGQTAPSSPGRETAGPADAKSLFPAFGEREPAIAPTPPPAAEPPIAVPPPPPPAPLRHVWRGRKELLGAPAHPSGVDKEDIRSAMKSLSPQVRECFQKRLAKRPDLEGKVVTDFILVRSPDGGSYAREGTIGDSTLNDPLVEACVLEKLRGAQFGAFKGTGEVRVRYPFVMNRSAEGFARGFGGTDTEP